MQEQLIKRKTNIIGLNKDEFFHNYSLQVEKPYRIKQIWKWIYKKGVKDFDGMTDLSKEFREDLKSSFEIDLPSLVKEERSTDGTIKWLFKLGDGNKIETVFIPDVDRGTVCISSQVGCTLSCAFCYTGTMKLVRNLSKEEIVGQLLSAKNILKDWEVKHKRKITNIVMMGMGEPLFNYDNVIGALKIFMDNEGLSISKRKITLSTSGVVPFIEKLKMAVRKITRFFKKFS